MQTEPVSQPVRLRNQTDGSFLSVRGVTANLNVDGPLVETRLVITFVNDTSRTIEGDLVFPLPPSTALRELKVRCGSRTLSGKLRPRSRAQAEYTRAVQAGHTAALGETEGEDLAHIKIAPIEKGEDVEVTLVLLGTLIPTAEGHRLVLPLTYMPRYVEDEAKLKPTEKAALDRPRPLTLAARANVHIVIQHPIGRNAPTVSCGSHTARTNPAESNTTVEIGPVALDHDLHLEINDRPAQGKGPALWLRYQPSDAADGLGPTTAVAVLPPAFADEGPTVPRTVTLLVDRSGSMGGGPMASALRAVRGCLRALGPADRFNIIAFDDQLEALSQRPLPFSDDSLREAEKFLSRIDARGGTEASKAMTAALTDVQAKETPAAVGKAPPLDAGHRLRVVVFMTDGDVAGAEAVLKSASAQLVDTRLHVIGIGASVQHSLLGQLAALGGGTYTPVSDESDLEKALARLKNTIDAPVLTGVQVVIEADGTRHTPKHVEPAGPLDVYAGRPLLFAFRGALPAGARLVLAGQQPGGEDLKLKVPLDLSLANDAAGLSSTVWALLRNRRLTYRFDPADDATLEALGSEFGLLNRKVALVAIHEDQRNVQVEGTLPVSLPMPQNLASPSMPVLSAPAPAPMMTQAGGYSGPPPAMMVAQAMRAGSASMGARPAAPGGPPPPPAPAAAAASLATPPQEPDLMMMESGAMPSLDDASFADEETDSPMAATADAGVSHEEEEQSRAKADSGFLGGVKKLFKRSAPKTPPSTAKAPAAPRAASAPKPPSPAKPMPAAAPARKKAEESDKQAKDAASRERFSDDEAGLRALLLQQGADGLFGGSIAATAAAVAALVGRGHTAREGLFRAELRRTLSTLRAQLPGLSGDDKALAALAIAILTMLQGEAAPEGLAADQAAALSGGSLRDLPALKAKIAQALRLAPKRSHALAASIEASFN